MLRWSLAVAVAWAALACVGAFHEDGLMEVPIPDGQERSRFGTTLCADAHLNWLIAGADIQSNLKGGAYVLDARKKLTSGAVPYTFILPDEAVELQGFDSKKVGHREKGSQFSFDCVMTADGNAAAISAPGHNLGAGKLYIYRQSGGAWSQAGSVSETTNYRNDGFGYRVAGSGDGSVLAVATRVRSISSGEVLIYQCEAGFANCKQSKKLACPSARATRSENGARIAASYGASMAMNKEGDRLIIGATGINEERGAAYIYEKRDTEWIFVASLSSGAPKVAGFFGFKVSMDDAGDVVAVGADGEDDYRGSAYIFRRKYSTWSLESSLRLSKRVAEDNFGGSVQLSGNGKVLLVGAPGAKVDRHVDAGELLVYHLSSGKWALQSKLESTSPQERAFFGWSSVINRDGTKFVVSAPHEDREKGKVYLGVNSQWGKKDPSSDSLAADDIMSVSHEDL
mmetsp:Transcript_594/g.1995  ORF Transcript_594/g.1995 Transcript_594/m.1995 type:complete len:455 (-) Transcript_594:1750-3114(-)